MKAQKGHLSHNFTHIIAPLIISFTFLIVHPNMYTNLNPHDVIAIALFGGLLPDIDHINIWLEYKFKNFRSFLRFVAKARRYRFSFLIFHNLGAVITITLLIPLINIITPIGAVFLISFLSHLLLDFFDDKFSLGRVTHWRYRRRT